LQEKQMLQIENINARIHEWTTGHFPLAKERNIGPSDSLLESGIVDSLGTLDIVMFLEQEFGFVVEDEEMLADHFETIESISNFVKSKFAD
jgi:acyl carrier protein